MVHGSGIFSGTTIQSYDPSTVPHPTIIIMPAIATDLTDTKLNIDPLTVELKMSSSHADIVTGQVGW